MIQDLFSHKIHSSSLEWQDKLVELAAIFNEFDGQVYDRADIERRLSSISPRISVSAAEAVRDPSKFRDEISAYPAYLGLYRLQFDGSNWRLYISETTKSYLLVDAPDVSAFMRLQLSLFQYPNGMGVAYSSENARIQVNASDRTLDFIHNNIHVSPFRLLCKSILADADLRGVDLFEAAISIPELYALVNHSNINKTASPKIEDIKLAITDIRAGRVNPPERFESRFHILDHTEMIDRGGHMLKIRHPENDIDREELKEKVLTISDITNEFEGFDESLNRGDLMDVIKSGSWGKYFDGVRTLSANIVKTLAKDSAITPLEVTRMRVSTPAQPPPLRYSFHQHTSVVSAARPSTRREDLADPQATLVKRERRTLMHKKMVTALNDLLQGKGSTAQENPHVDLYAEIPNDGAYLFEVKSGGDNLLAQIRKGVSQLYEYRFRYKDDIRRDVTLCLVLPDEPTGIPWLEEYLCTDREIAICWLNNSGQVTSADLCKSKLSQFIEAPAIQ